MPPQETGAACTQHFYRCECKAARGRLCACTARMSWGTRIAHKAVCPGCCTRQGYELTCSRRHAGVPVWAVGRQGKMPRQQGHQERSRRVHRTAWQKHACQKRACQDAPLADRAAHLQCCRAPVAAEDADATSPRTHTPQQPVPCGVSALWRTPPCVDSHQSVSAGHPTAHS